MTVLVDVNVLIAATVTDRVDSEALEIVSGLRTSAAHEFWPGDLP